MAHTLAIWQGEFGNAYTDRNVIDACGRSRAFQEMLAGLPIQRVLEVGCNRGHNLVTLAELLREDQEVVGIEPNRHALALARGSSPRVSALASHAFDIPFKDGYFDLVFTAGVLIHIPTADLPSALAEIYRVSKRYLLAIEYFAEEETIVHYRGHDDLLWKRDFLRLYRAEFPDLTLLRGGFWGPEDGFDNAHWWLLEKSGGSEKR